ncbi:uncharacterized protein [Panulirus ornatus]|uniref:uncharacterized protein n=1 Tax=Panulirus ornatus TaxID=150431 RepID=UPI003A842DFC
MWLVKSKGVLDFNGDHTAMDGSNCGITRDVDNIKEKWREQEMEGKESQGTIADTLQEKEFTSTEACITREMHSDGIVDCHGGKKGATLSSELIQQKRKEVTECSNVDNCHDVRQNSNTSLSSRQSEKLYKCEQCDSVFSQKCNLKRHLKLHSGYKPFICKECGLSFYEQDSLKKHTRTHTGEKPYTCENCGKSFAHSGHLKIHKRIHSGEKPYICQECGLSFSQAGNLKVHMRVHTGEKPHVCKICGSAFSISSVFKKHKMVHTGERPYKCSYCDARFSSNSNLSRHNKTHTGEKPFKCQVCSAAFPVKNSLDRHMKSHTGERPYCCEMCGAVFADMSDLTKHRKTHTGEKHLRCNVCGMGFFSKSQMNIHIRTHTGEKPHRCLVCGVSFAQIGTLNKHKRTHTGEKPFRCDECGTLFTAKSSLKKHLERHSYSVSSLGMNTAEISGLQRAESQSTSFYDVQNKVVGDNNMCSHETLPLSSKVVGVSSLTSTVEIGVMALNTNSDVMNPKHALSGSSSSLPGISSSSLHDDHSTLMAMDIGSPTPVSHSGVVGRDGSYNSSLHAIGTSIPQPISSSLRSPTTFANRNSTPLAFTDLQNENGFCDLEKNSLNVNSSPRVSAALDYLHSLPAVPIDSSVQSTVTANTVPRLSSV